MATQQTERPGLADWRQKVEELYGLIRVWASEMEPAATFGTEEITLIEKWSGAYQISQLLLEQGGDRMTVRPVARAVVGADGRVDLLGLDGPFTLFLMEAEEDSMIAENGKNGFRHESTADWYWLQDRAPWESARLDGPLFRDLAESCLR